MCFIVIKCENLSKSYGNHPALKGLHLHVAAGALYGFIGPNGAGKTTTIRLLMGLLRPSCGKASIFDRDCWHESKTAKRQVGYLPGEVLLYPWLTGLEAQKILGMAHGRNLSESFSHLAEYFDLDLAIRVRNMSRGMRQKLGLILALAHQPGLLILDEPTTALDPLTQDRLYDHLRARARQGSTVFFSSHILSEVADLCDRVAVIRAGELVADEALDTLRARAPRQVTLVWPPGTGGPNLPDFLEISKRDSDSWTCFLKAPVPQFLEWLAVHEPLDLTIGPPDLDSLFRSYYHNEVSV